MQMAIYNAFLGFIMPDMNLHNFQIYTLLWKFPELADVVVVVIVAIEHVIYL